MWPRPLRPPRRSTPGCGRRWRVGDATDRTDSCRILRSKRRFWRLRRVARVVFESSGDPPPIGPDHAQGAATPSSAREPSHERHARCVSLPRAPDNRGETHNRGETQGSTGGRGGDDRRQIGAAGMKARGRAYRSASMVSV
jgi:hypothetical protein